MEKQIQRSSKSLTFEMNNYFQEVKLICGHFDNCNTKNIVNCKRCLDATEMFKNLYAKLGFKGDILKKMLDSIREIADLQSPNNSSNYNCNRCEENHLIDSDIGKDHLKFNQGIKLK